MSIFKHSVSHFIFDIASTLPHIATNRNSLRTVACIVDWCQTTGINFQLLLSARNENSLQTHETTLVRLWITTATISRAATFAYKTAALSNNNQIPRCRFVCVHLHYIYLHINFQTSWYTEHHITLYLAGVPLYTSWYGCNCVLNRIDSGIAELTSVPFVGPIIMGRMWSRTQPDFLIYGGDSFISARIPRMIPFLWDEIIRKRRNSLTIIIKVLFCHCGHRNHYL